MAHHQHYLKVSSISLNSFLSYFAPHQTDNHSHNLFGRGRNKHSPLSHHINGRWIHGAALPSVPSSTYSLAELEGVKSSPMYRNSHFIHPWEPSRAFMSQRIWSVLKNSHFLRCEQKKLMVFLKLQTLEHVCSFTVCTLSVAIARRSKALGPVSVWGGLVLWLIGLSPHYRSCVIHPFCRGSQRTTRMLFLLFSLNFCGAVGKQQDLYSFQLIAALRDSTRKYVPKICLSQITNCSLSYVYVD